MLKAGFLSLFVFVWIIGAVLGATFEYANTAAGDGQAYSTGTATFVKGDATVTGAATVWVNAMEGGNIKSNTDGKYYRILTVTDGTHLELSAIYDETGGAGHNYTMVASTGFPTTTSGKGGYEDSPTNTLEYLVNWKNAFMRVPQFGNFPLPLPNGQYFETAFKVITWQWNFIYDEYPLLYWIICAPFVMMGVLSLLLLIYGIISGNITI